MGSFPHQTEGKGGFLSCSSLVIWQEIEIINVYRLENCLKETQRQAVFPYLENNYLPKLTSLTLMYDNYSKFLVNLLHPDKNVQITFLRLESRTKIGFSKGRRDFGQGGPGGACILYQAREFTSPYPMDAWYGCKLQLDQKILMNVGIPLRQEIGEEGFLQAIQQSKLEFLRATGN